MLNIKYIEQSYKQMTSNENFNSLNDLKDKLLEIINPSNDWKDKPLEKSTFLLPDRDDNINKAYSYLINLIRSV